jgi:hypothetical protein
MVYLNDATEYCFNQVDRSHLIHHKTRLYSLHSHIYKTKLDIRMAIIPRITAASPHSPRSGTTLPKNLLISPSTAPLI